MRLLDKRHIIIDNEPFEVNYDDSINKNVCNERCSFIFRSCTVSKGRYLCDLVMSDVGHKGSVYFTCIKEEWYKNMSLIISSYMKTR